MRPAALASWVLLALVAVYCYWSAMAGLVQRWWTDPDYLYGFLVPAFAGFLLWFRRGLLPGALSTGSAWGLALLAIAALMRFASAYYYYELLDPASLVPCLAGLALFLGGWQVLRWAWPAAALLAFMVPLPGFLATLMSHPLQRMATTASTYVIQTLGIPAVAEGNIISLSEGQIGVAEACSGLRNMMLFIVICVAMALVMRRSLLEKAIIVLSAAPIALIANVVRITATALLHEMARHELATSIYHDLAAWFMMPLAVVLLWMELAILKRVFVSVAVDEPFVGTTRSQGAA
jgi:exosortase